MGKKFWIIGLVLICNYLFPDPGCTYYTNSKLVNLVVSSTEQGDGALMRFSNDGINWSETEPFATVKKNWDLTMYGGGEENGSKIIHLKLKDPAGNWSITKITVSIDLDWKSPYLDTDSDGMPDRWEEKYGLNRLVNDADLDYDQDSFTNLEEYQSGWDPTHHALTLYVDDDASANGDGSVEFPLNTISQAIEQAVAGDTILVLEGDYPENLGLVMKDGVDLISELGYQSTIGLEGTGFIDGANYSTISGFTIINPLGNAEAIRCLGTSPTIYNNVIIPSVEGAAGIRVADSSSARIYNNTIIDAYIGIEIDSASPVIMNNTVVRNTLGIVMHSGAPSIDYNNVWGNEGIETCLEGDYCGVTPGLNDISVDPRFWSPKMLHQ